ncbi:hydroxymethylbilane synthase, partial [Streptomyces althioticus]
MAVPELIRIVSRDSPMALAQVERVRAELTAAHPGVGAGGGPGGGPPPQGGGGRGPGGGPGAVTTGVGAPRGGGA